MNMDKLNQLVKLHKDFRELYRDPAVGIAGVDDMGVHLTTESFVATFTDYSTHTRDSFRYPLEFRTEHGGVRFFCILEKEEYDEISGKQEEDESRI